MIFEYSGKLATGESIKGKLEVETRREALISLADDGIVPLSLKEKSVLSKDLKIKKKLKNADFVMFLRQYATLINAGVSISESTKTMVAQVKNERLKDALEDVDIQVDRGESLSTAMGRHPKVFPELLVNMVVAGEESGRLDDMLENMADFYERQYSNKRKMTSAMMYPGAVSILAVVMVIFVLTFMIPTFADMFAKMDAELPAYTQFILNMSNFVRERGLLLAAIVSSIIGTGYVIFKNERVKYEFDRLLVRIPLLGPLFHKMAIVRLTQTLSMLLNAAIPILTALQITESVIGNRVMAGHLEEVQDELQGGGEISSVLAKYAIFPIIVVQMVQVGESTGKLDHMLSKLTDFYQEDVDQLINRFGSLIEPILIVGLAFVVGSLMLAVVIPMFSMYENF